MTYWYNWIFIVTLQYSEIDDIMNDRAIMDYYDRRRMTRSQFEEFLHHPQDTETLCHLPDDISTDQWNALLKAGDSVCRIDIKDESGTFSPIGTGFHPGGGWVVTNQHVIDFKEDGKSCASIVRFVFPQNIIFPPAPRNVVFSYFQDPDGTKATDDSKKDLALIHVEEIAEIIPPLTSIFDKPANEGERVFLIHYGDGVEDKQNPPQQFSVSDNEVCLTHANQHGNIFSVHTAHSRPGSSGAPLLVFNEHQKKFLVAGVHYAGPELAEIIDSPGFALWYNYFGDNNWRQQTVIVPCYIENICQWAMSNSNRSASLDKAVKQECLDGLKTYLEEHSLRVALKVKLPDGVDFSYENIIFAE